MGTRPPAAEPLHDGRHRPSGSRRTTTAAKLIVVDLITEHDVQADQQLASERDFRLGAAASMQDCEVVAPKVLVGPGREGGGLPQDPSQERVALLGDLAEALFVGRGIDRRRQADVTDDMLAIRKARDRSQNEHGREGGQRPHAGVRQQPPGLRIGFRDRGDLFVECVDARRQPAKQLKILVATTAGVNWKGQRGELSEPRPRSQFRAERYAVTEGDGLKAVLDHGAHPDQPDTVPDQGAEVPGVRIRNPHARESIVLQEIE